MIRRLAILSLLAAAVSVRAAERYIWKNVGIGGGGFVSGVVFSPLEKGLAYARTDVGGAYRWEGARREWVAITDGFGRGQEETNHTGVLSIALHPTDPDVVYLATGLYTQSWWHAKAAVLFSKDRGRRWARQPLPFMLGGNEDGRNTGERLQVDPSDPGHLLLGTTRDGLWESRKAGVWKRVPGFKPAAVTFVLFDPNAKLVYAGSTDKGGSLHWSRDKGLTWSSVPGQPKGLLALRGVLDGPSLLATFSDTLGPNGISKGGVYRFRSEGAKWEQLPLPAGQGGFCGVSVDPQKPGTIVVSTLDRWKEKDEIFLSRDHGATWRGLVKGAKFDHRQGPYTEGFTPHWTGDVQIDPFDSEHVVFNTGYGLWASHDMGRADKKKPLTWVFDNKGLEETVPLAIVSPPTGAHLHSAIGDVAGFRHDDLDAPAKRLPGEPKYGSQSGIAFAAARPQTMVRAVEHVKDEAGYLSVDGGTTWKPFTGAPAKNTDAGRIALNADASAIVLAFPKLGLFRSGDLGKTWTKSEGAPAGCVPEADGVDPELVYALDAKAGRLYVSRDRGSAFRAAAKLVPAEDGGSLRAVPGRRGELWLALPSGLFRSVDAGASVQALQGVGEAHLIGFGKAAPGAGHPAVFLDGTLNGVQGFYRSDNAGQSWLWLNPDGSVKRGDTGSRFGWLRDISGDPRVFGRVYLATSGRGILYGDPGSAQEKAAK